MNALPLISSTQMYVGFFALLVVLSVIAVVNAISSRIRAYRWLHLHPVSAYRTQSADQSQPLVYNSAHHCIVNIDAGDGRRLYVLLERGYTALRSAQQNRIAMILHYRYIVRPVRHLRAYSVVGASNGMTIHHPQSTPRGLHPEMGTQRLEGSM